MEATALSVGKSALDGALSYAKSAIAEEVTLQLGIQRDQAFIRDELQMMQSFLMAADKEHGDHGVLKTWVKQVRDVAYDVEDCLQDYVVRLEKTSWWRLPGTKLREGHRIAKEMKELRAKVEDVSQRNMRYHLIGGSAAPASKPSAMAPAEQSDAIFKIEARRAAKQEKVDLVQLITKEGDDLRVMAVCGSVDVRMTSIVRAAYQKVKGKFECPAWVRLTRPFNPKEFIGSLVRQFQESSCHEAGEIPQGIPTGVSILNKMEAQSYNLVDDFNGYVTKRYLIVLNGLSTIEEWDWIKTYLPDNHQGSRIVLCTEHAEVASCCIEDGPKMSEIQQEGPFVNPLYVFYKEDSPPDQADKPESTSTDSNTLDGRALQALFAEDEAPIKRKDANSEIVELISKGGKVVAVWGMGAVGETALVRSVYENLAGDMFQKRGWVSIKRPFIQEELLKMLVQQLHQDDGREDGDKKSKLQDDTHSSKRKKGTADSTRKLLTEILSQNRCLLVIDDVSIAEWDSIMKNVLPIDGNAANRIIVTAKEFSVAIHCSGEKQYTYKLEAPPSDDDTIGRLKNKDSSGDEHDKPDFGSSVSAGNSSMLPAGENQAESMGSDTEEGMALQSLFEENEAPIKREDVKSDVIELICKDGMVISVWGMADVDKTVLVRSVYEGLGDRFQKRAWFSMERPFSQEQFIQCMVTQLHQGDESQDEEDTSDHAVELKCCWIFKRHKTQNSKRHRRSTHQSTRQSLAEILSQNQCLLVIDDVSSREEWDLLMEYLLHDDVNAANRIIIITREFGVAIHCSGEDQYTYKLEAPNDDDTFSHFKNKVDSQSVSPDSISSKSDAYDAGGTSKAVHFNDVVQEGDYEGKSGSSSPRVLSKDPGPVAAKKLTRSMTLAAADQAQLIGRKEEKDEVIELLSQDRTDRQVVSVWGMGGIGKTTLVRSIYQSPELERLKFERRAWVTVLRPFRPTELLRSLAQRLVEDSPGKKQGESISLGGLKNDLTMMGTKDLIVKLRQELDGRKYLIVLDDLSSTAEWDSIIKNLPANNNGSRIIVTTRPKGVAQHCSQKEANVHSIEGLTHNDALELFINKVYKERDESELRHDLLEEANIIVKKCGRLPLAIATVGGFLSTRPRNIKEWRKFIDHISVELENNPELDMIKTALNSSYDGLPYHLKSCFLYLSIFPEDHNIRCRRLVRRWIAEGYSREVRSKTAEEVAEEHFTHIINRSMIQPSKRETHKTGNTTDFCQVHDLMREISISKSQEENLVFVLDEHSTRRSKEKVRHLVVSRSWSREKKHNALESIMDVSHIRSLTVFGEWRSYFFSKKMRMLRVLDLEDAEDLQDRDLVPIGKLHHLKYLSLRGSKGIFHLPDSFGNLLNLETLDIRGTCVTELPGTVRKLEKLKYLRAGMQPDDEDDTWSDFPLLPLVIIAMCSEYFSGEILEEVAVPRFVSILVWLVKAYLRHMDLHGVEVPKGIGRLRALHTLGIVNVARGKAFLKNLERLTQLRKLGVTGITKNNCEKLCSAIVDHGRLRSLFLRAEGEAGLQGCLDGLSPPPEYLESLKLYGNLVTLPEWFGQLDNLQKLSLRSTNLDMVAAIDELGKLPMLAILRLQDKACKGEILHFRLEGFPNLMMLELVSWTRLESVKFEDGATPKLEVVRVDRCRDIDDDGFHGIKFLSSLKEVSLEGYYNARFMNDLKEQLDENKSKPNLKIV